MTGLYVLVLVCGVHDPVCDTRTARAYSAYRAPEGILLCGLPGMVPAQTGSLSPDKNEYVVVKCKIGN